MPSTCLLWLGGVQPKIRMRNEFIALRHGLRRASPKPGSDGLPAEISAGRGCVRNPRTTSALGLHSCRALSSETVNRQYTIKPTNPKNTKSVTYVPGRKCYPCIGTHRTASSSSVTLPVHTTESPWKAVEWPLEALEAQVSAPGTRDHSPVPMHPRRQAEV